jgi:hypothetical protein
VGAILIFKQYSEMARGLLNRQQESMKANNNSRSRTSIKLSKTFFNIANGQLSASEVAAKKRAEKEAARAEAVRKGKILDRTDPFMANFGH